MSTLVKFRYNNCEGDLFAYFPQRNYNKKFHGTQIKIGYAHTGQHTAVQIDYANACVPATPEQYAPLLVELKGQGYNDLKICK
jgi:hypothetical protein